MNKLLQKLQPMLLFVLALCLVQAASASSIDFPEAVFSGQSFFIIQDAGGIDCSPANGQCEIRWTSPTGNDDGSRLEGKSDPDPDNGQEWYQFSEEGEYLIEIYHCTSGGNPTCNAAPEDTDIVEVVDIIEVQNESEQNAIGLEFFYSANTDELIIGGYGPIGSQSATINAYDSTGTVVDSACADVNESEDPEFTTTFNPQGNSWTADSIFFAAQFYDTTGCTGNTVNPNAYGGEFDWLLLQQILSQLEQLEGQINGTNSTVNIQIEELINITNILINITGDLNSSIQNNTEMINNIQNNITNIYNNISSIEANLTELYNILNQVIIDISVLENSVVTIQGDITNLYEIVDDLQDQIDTFQDQIDNVTTIVEGIEAQLQVMNHGTINSEFINQVIYVYGEAPYGADNARVDFIDENGSVVFSYNITVDQSDSTYEFAHDTTTWPEIRYTIRVSFFDEGQFIGLGEQPHAVIKGSDWLLSVRNADGGWSFLEPGTQSSYGYSSEIGRALLLAHQTSGRAEYLTTSEDLASDYLVNNWDDYSMSCGEILYLAELSEETGNNNYLSTAKTLWDQRINAFDSVEAMIEDQIYQHEINTYDNGLEDTGSLPYLWSHCVQDALVLNEAYPGQGYNVQAETFVHTAYDYVIVDETFDMDNTLAVWQILGINSMYDMFLRTGLYPTEEAQLRARLLALQSATGELDHNEGRFTDDTQATAHFARTMTYEGSPESLAAADEAVQWLISEQRADGSWYYLDQNPRTYPYGTGGIIIAIAEKTAVEQGSNGGETVSTIFESLFTNYLYRLINEQFPVVIADVEGLEDTVDVQWNYNLAQETLNIQGYAPNAAESVQVMWTEITSSAAQTHAACEPVNNTQNPEFELSMSTNGWKPAAYSLEATFFAGQDCTGVEAEPSALGGTFDYLAIQQLNAEIEVLYDLVNETNTSIWEQLNNLSNQTISIETNITTLWEEINNIWTLIGDLQTGTINLYHFSDDNGEYLNVFGTTPPNATTVWLSINTVAGEIWIHGDTGTVDDNGRYFFQVNVEDFPTEQMNVYAWFSEDGTEWVSALFDAKYLEWLANNDYGFSFIDNEYYTLFNIQESFSRNVQFSYMPEVSGEYYFRTVPAGGWSTGTQTQCMTLTGKEDNTIQTQVWFPSYEETFTMKIEAVSCDTEEVVDESNVFLFVVEDLATPWLTSGLQVVDITSAAEGTQMWYTNQEQVVVTAMLGDDTNWEQCHAAYFYAPGALFPYAIWEATDIPQQTCTGPVDFSNEDRIEPTYYKGQMPVYQMKICKDISLAGTCDVVNVGIDTIAPEVSFVYPEVNGMLGGVETLALNISDDGEISSVPITLIDAENASNMWNLGYANFNVNTELWELTVDTAIVPDGEYNITANATDLAGNSGFANTSATIDNTNPEVVSVDVTGVGGENLSIEVTVTDETTGVTSVVANIVRYTCMDAEMNSTDMCVSTHVCENKTYDSNYSESITLELSSGNEFNGVWGGQIHAENGWYYEVTITAYDNAGNEVSVDSNTNSTGIETTYYMNEEYTVTITSQQTVYTDKETIELSGTVASSDGNDLPVNEIVVDGVTIPLVMESYVLNRGPLAAGEYVFEAVYTPNSACAETTTKTIAITVTATSSGGGSGGGGGGGYVPPADDSEENGSTTGEGHDSGIDVFDELPPIVDEDTSTIIKKDEKVAVESDGEGEEIENDNSNTEDVVEENNSDNLLTGAVTGTGFFQQNWPFLLVLLALILVLLGLSRLKK